MAPSSDQDGGTSAKPQKQILLNAFDMFTVGHLSFGQWRNPKDRAKDKRRDLTYWTDLAKLLDKGGFVGLFLADTFGPYDTLASPHPLHQPTSSLLIWLSDTRGAQSHRLEQALNGLWPTLSS